MWLPDFAWALGAAYYATGRNAEGIALMEGAARDGAEHNMMWTGWAGHAGALGGDTSADARLGDAFRSAEAGLAAARHRGEREVEGRLLRLVGDIAAHPDRFDAERGEAHYRQALALAEPRGMRPLVAHCHLGLGKLYRRSGKRHEAQEHFTIAATMYREMDMRFWLESAEIATTQVA